MKFRLAPQGEEKYVSGTHYHEGKPYRHNDVIESDEDLQIKYPGKFTRMPDETPVTPPRKGTSPQPGQGRPTDEFEDPQHNPPVEELELEPEPAADLGLRRRNRRS